MSSTHVTAEKQACHLGKVTTRKKKKTHTKEQPQRGESNSGASINLHSTLLEKSICISN